MTSIDQAIRNVRPKLRHVAPQTYWSSMAFGVFNAVIGYALLNYTILLTLNLLGVIPVQLWAVTFLIHGLLLLVSLPLNNWKMTRTLHLMGVALKMGWWLELFAVTIDGRTPFLLYVWSLLIILQIIIYVHFTPRVSRAK